jgi:curli production assembly/transport component CsgE
MCHTITPARWFCFRFRRDTLVMGMSLALGPFAGPASAQSIAPETPPAAPSSVSNIKHKNIVDGAPLSPSSAPSGNGSALVIAPPSMEVGDKRALQESLVGIVTDQVVTLIGQNFYGYFVAAWRELPLASRYNISIHEKPSARWGSLVWIEFERRHLFEAFLSPTRSNVKLAAERAANVAYQNMVRTDIERLLFRDQDLGSDEM